MLGVILSTMATWGDAPLGWRILPARDYSNEYSWYVRELEVYASPDCSGDKIPPWDTVGSVAGHSSAP